MMVSDDRPPLSVLTPDALRTRALTCRKMAATARMAGTLESLLRLADAYEELAVEGVCTAPGDEVLRPGHRNEPVSLGR